MRPSMGLGRSLAWVAIVGALYAAVVRFAFCAGGGHGLVGSLIGAPVVAVLVTPALLALFPAYLDWARGRIWRKWQGRYYAFDDRQIRIVGAHDALWFLSADVHAVLGMRPRIGVLSAFGSAERRRDTGLDDALSNAGLIRLLARSTDRRVRRFMRWAEHDVRRPWQKKRELEAPAGP